MYQQYPKTKKNDSRNTNTGVKLMPVKGEENRQAGTAGGFSATEDKAPYGDSIDTQVTTEIDDMSSQEYDIWLNDCYKEWEEWLQERARRRNKRLKGYKPFYINWKEMTHD